MSAQSKQEYPPLTLENMKVFKVNDYDWVAASDEKTAVDWYVDYWKTNCDRDATLDEIIDEPVEELSLDSPMQTEDTPDGRWADTTVRAVLTAYIERGRSEPYVVASSEY